MEIVAVTKKAHEDRNAVMGSYHERVGIWGWVAEVVVGMLRLLAVNAPVGQP